MDRSINAGTIGFIIAIMINLFSPVYLAFIPSFFAAIFAIYMYRLATLRESFVAAFMTYIFNDGILNTIQLAILYASNEPYTITVELWIVFTPLASAVTAVIAGIIGLSLVRRRKPVHELPPSLPPPLPPV